MANEMWSDYTDYVISSIDGKISGKYNLSIRDFLSNPAKYAKKENIKTEGDV
jgi:predicted RNA-binding protein with RPS1 domain